MYEFGIGHYLYYPLGVFALSAVFFFWGYGVGRRRERTRLALDAEPSRAGS